MARFAPDEPARWPALPLEAWTDTKATLHRYCQVVGKVRMSLVPFPPGLTDEPLEPSMASWDTQSGTANLSYEDVRTSGAPRSAILDFFTSAYEAGARTAGWDRAALATRATPARR